MRIQPKLINAYVAIGALYGSGRAWYWLTRLNESTYTDKPKDMWINHPPTLDTWLSNGTIQIGTSMVAWPLYCITDISLYQKSKMGIRDMCPPFPFTFLKWK